MKIFQFSSVWKVLLQIYLTDALLTKTQYWTAQMKFCVVCAQLDCLHSTVWWWSINFLRCLAYFSHLVSAIASKALFAVNRQHFLWTEWFSLGKGLWNNDFPEDSEFREVIFVHVKIQSNETLKVRITACKI